MACCLLLAACDTGVAPSPDPGVLRVTLQADPADNTIAVGKDVLTVAPGDRFDVTVFQGKVYRDSVFAVLLPTLDAYREQDAHYNVLARRGEAQPARYTIFESYVPPGAYDRLQFGATATELRIGGFVIPMALPPNTPGLMDFEADFEVVENDTTEITLRIKPFQSVARFRDSYQFTRQIEVVDVVHR